LFNQNNQSNQGTASNTIPAQNNLVGGVPSGNQGGMFNNGSNNPPKDDLESTSLII
jgi:hypothetical protein